jgi:predicted ArsR family transcriptional regulator
MVSMVMIRSVLSKNEVDVRLLAFFRQYLYLIEMRDAIDEQLSSVAALGEPVRRALYRYVIEQREPVSREQAAGGAGVARHVAKFHLDRLVADGLLDTEYRRPPGRSGPGAGRPAKLYRRAEREIEVSLPQRRYDLAGQVLARAVTIAGESGAPLDRALREAATAAGRALPGETGADADESGGDPLAAVAAVLAAHGYEPHVRADAITLGNCPFHSLAREFPDLVCGLNLDLLRGMVGESGAGALQPRLEPGTDRCCVVLARSAGR